MTVKMALNLAKIKIEYKFLHLLAEQEQPTETSLYMPETVYHLLIHWYQILKGMVHVVA